MNNKPAAKRTEPTMNECGEGRESSSPAAIHWMFNFGDSDACTADTCMAKEG